MRRDQTTIRFTKQLFREDVGPQKIESIQFSTFSGTDALKAAEFEIFRDRYYDSNMRPVDNGLLDLRMGPPKSGAFCKTCGGSYVKCPGHWGYLPLALPVYNVGYLNTVVGVLKSICKEKLREMFLKRMRNPNSEHLKKAEILKAVVRESEKVIDCPKCGYKNGFTKLGSSTIEYRVEGDSGIVKKILDPQMVYQLLKNVQDADCELLYIKGRPENLVVTNILVPPTVIRPSRTSGDSSIKDDISKILGDIIRENSYLQQQLSEPEPGDRILETWERLQYWVAHYINSESRWPLGVFPPNQRTGFAQRIKGKQGRFRSNLRGKRVEYTARTVISSDPNLKVTEVGIPMFVALILTYPERVTHHNIEKLPKCGLSKYPGAKMLIPADGIPIALMGHFRRRLADELKFGDIVERYLEDGDIVLFNRQPSLHMMSMMCHRARIMPWRTLRFNESVCNPYNADFDGDEMNLHVPQTEEARAKALMLMAVQNNLCTPKNGEILVASTKDFLTSSYLITRKDTFYNRSTFALLCCYLGDGMEQIDLPTPALIKPVELWTVKQLFSVQLRPHANRRIYVNLTVAEKCYDKCKETMCSNDGFVYIRNSDFISGQLGKAALGNGNKDGLYSVLLRDYGSYAATSCMNRLEKLSDRWIGNHGFSIGIDDVQPGDALSKEKMVMIDKEYGHCTDYIKSYASRCLELQSGCNKVETLEAEITKILNNISQRTADVRYSAFSELYSFDFGDKLY